MKQFTIKQYYSEITPNDGQTYGYALIGITECVMSNCVAWIGTITKDGRPIGSVECHGDGGCYSYWFNEVIDNRNFNQAVKKAYAGREMIDVEEDCFINWLDYQQQGGN